MSESLVDRILVGHSIDGNGPLGRSLREAQTSGRIRHDAPHWSIEPYIPLTPAKLIDYLLARGELPIHHEQPFRSCCDELDKILQDRTAVHRTRFADLYPFVDPDADQREPAIPVRHAHAPAPACEETAADTRLDSVAKVETHNASDGLKEQIAGVLQICEENLKLAGFRHLATNEITRCVGVSSQYGVPLKVDMDIFEQLAVYARGDILGSRIRRRLRNFYRREEVEVQLYQRMVVIFQLTDDDPSDEHLIAAALHLRVFKNIPKLDVDALLPGARVRITGIDRVKIIVPSLGGFLMSLQRIAKYVLLFAVIALHWSAILAGLLIGYAVKSVLSYFRTKNRYQLSLTRNLYFQKLDANAGAGYHIIQMAHQQRVLEAILAQYAILTSEQAVSHRRLRRKCERLIREAIHVEVDFQVDRALEGLLQLGSIRPTDGDSWIAEPSKFL